MEKKFKKKNKLLKKKQLNILMKMIWMKEVKQNLLLKKTLKIIFKMCKKTKFNQEINLKLQFKKKNIKQEKVLKFEYLQL